MKIQFAFATVHKCGGPWLLAAAAGAFMLGSSDAAEPQAPLGLPAIFWPDDNLYSDDKVELGRLLYFDKRLSSDGTVACASCHSSEFAFTDGRAFSSGIGGQVGGRSAPTVINSGYRTNQFWDGRVPSLKEQAKGPIANDIEMTHENDPQRAFETSIDRLKEVNGYVDRFEKVFGTKDFTIDHVAKAIATFERTILSGNAPYDRYKAGDKSAMSESQVRGMDVFFNTTKCDSCHLGFNFTDSSYANVGIGMDKPNPDLGRFNVSQDEEDKGAFKTPTLREIANTGPYMHDGRFKTLEEVIEHYDVGGIKNPYLDRRIKALKLSEQEKKDLVAFLKALSGEGWQHIKAPKTFPE